MLGVTRAAFNGLNLAMVTPQHLTETRALNSLRIWANMAEVPLSTG